MADPVGIAGCVLWLDASQESYADGAVVGTWVDRSGAGNHGVAPAGREPVFAVGALNGLPVLDFATDKFYELPGIFDTGGGSTFVVPKFRTLSGGPVLLSGSDLSGSSDRRRRWYFLGSSGDEMANASGPNTYTFNPEWSSAFDGDTEWRAWGFGSDGTTARMTRRCGRNTTSGSETHERTLPSTYSGAAATAATIGRLNAVDTQPFGGLVAEVIHYSRFLTSSEFRQVLAYLTAKWDVGCGDGWIVGSVAIG